MSRSEKMTLRLTPEEAALRDALADHLGVNEAGVMRMALLKLGRAEGIAAPIEKSPSADPPIR